MPSTPERARRQSKEHWENLVHECLDGNYKKSEFCKDRGIKYAAFMFHCNRIKKKLNATTVQDSVLPNKLIAMKLVTAGEDTTTEIRSPVLCSLTLKNGITLRIHDRECFNDIVSRLTSSAAII
jgi:hypothetical protein